MDERGASKEFQQDRKGTTKRNIPPYEEILAALERIPCLICHVDHAHEPATCVDFRFDFSLIAERVLEWLLEVEEDGKDRRAPVSIQTPEAHARAIQKATDIVCREFSLGNTQALPLEHRLIESIGDALTTYAAERERAVWEEAAREHENINPASDAELLKLLPGAGAMGAIIEYRDRLRARAGDSGRERQ